MGNNLNKHTNIVQFMQCCFRAETDWKHLRILSGNCTSQTDATWPLGYICWHFSEQQLVTDDELASVTWSRQHRCRCPQFIFISFRMCCSSNGLTNGKWSWLLSNLFINRYVTLLCISNPQISLTHSDIHFNTLSQWTGTKCYNAFYVQCTSAQK